MQFRVEGGGVSPQVEEWMLAHFLMPGQVIGLPLMGKGQLVDHVLQLGIAGGREQVEPAAGRWNVCPEGGEIDRSGDAGWMIGIGKKPFQILDENSVMHAKSSSSLLAFPLPL